MDAINALLTRNSVALLTEPAPSKKQLDNIFQAGLRANDHRHLRPWKILQIDGGAREKLGELILEISLEDNPDLSIEKQGQIVAKALRAPLILVMVAVVRDNEKVPDIEQLLSAGGAAQLMMLAAHAQGVGAVWRTGSIAYDKRMIRGLDLEEGDHIVGFLYMGTPKVVKPLQSIDVDDFVIHWGADL
ncbi:MAG: nitroreductase family protein [Spongiibacteraceae bacterium]|nr:nitroreductase family protein [Spongiibacteraceae bacterium]